MFCLGFTAVPFLELVQGAFPFVLSSLGLVTVPLVREYGKLINSEGNLSSGKVGGDVAEQPLHQFSPDR